MVGPLNVGCYITDSYIIETHPRTIRVVPLYEIESVDIINNYELKKSGGKKYTGSNLQVMYLDHLEEFNIDTVLKAKGIQETIKNKINEIKQSILSGQNQFENNGDMFHDVQFQPIYSLLKKKSTNNKLLFLYKLLLALVLSSIICCIFWVKNNKEFYKTPADVTQVEFPENDVIYNSKDSNDDLSILVLENCKESDNLVIKIKSKSIFNNWAATAYINKKSSVIVRMPPGKYTIYKAEGTTWYGEKYLFGDYTEFSQIGSTFKISTGDWRTIQIGVKDGNLGETNLRPNSFKK